jgi:hypothetical protein
MKLERDNIPASVEAVAKNMFDETNRINIRENYKRTLLDIRDYCDAVVKHYDHLSERQQLKMTKKKGFG